jgi:hypothetical protein
MARVEFVQECVHFCRLEEGFSRAEFDVGQSAPHPFIHASDSASKARRNLFFCQVFLFILRHVFLSMHVLRALSTKEGTSVLTVQYRGGE